MQKTRLCFVLMPFGIRKDSGGGADIDFDAIYEQAIRPAIQAASMEPLRADEEFTTSSGLQKTISERLLLSDFAVADVTMRNPQVFLDLSARNALRPGTTLAIFARNEKLPLDAGDLRVLAYDLADGNRFTTREAVKLRRALTRELERLSESAPDFSALETGSLELRKQTLDAAEKERAIA